jgi:hypothetical protein
VLGTARVLCGGLRLWGPAFRLLALVSGLDAGYGGGWAYIVTTPDGNQASLAQSVERETLNLKVAGSTPAWGFLFCSPGVFFFAFW